MHDHRGRHVSSGHVRLHVDSRPAGKENPTVELHNRHGALYVLDRCLLLPERSPCRRFVDRVHSARVLVRVHNIVLRRFRSHPVDADRRDLTGANQR